MNKNNIILVTGAAGFIGSSLINSLISNKENTIVGIDNLNDYYDVNLKIRNIERNKANNYTFIKCDICDNIMLKEIFHKYNITQVYHLAAQAGVRYSINNAKEVINTNIIGFQNIIENCIKCNINKLVYASSSSVYGNIFNESDNENDKCDNQMSPYAVTKRCNELMAQMYSNIYPNLQLTGLRFFTVYGPYMRPDLAISKFTHAVLNDEYIDIYGDGCKERDFTYIDDIIRIMMTIMNSTKIWHHEVFNIGCNDKISIRKLVDIIKDEINPSFEKIHYTTDAIGDVDKTLASNAKIKEWFNDYPQIDIKTGIKKYIKWHIKKR